jgi:response regulator RpfG family c-di-GMP phosphodiesterase
MIRPCYLVLDREVPGNISTRKLVIETAKLNVITAYSPDEAIATLERYPRVDGVVFSAELPSMKTDELIQRIRGVVPEIPIIVTSAGSPRRNERNVYYIDSLDPKALLNCLQSLNKEAVKEIAKADPEIQI